MPPPTDPMRIDHFAYQQAARIAALGLLLQGAIAVVVFVFGQFVQDTACVFASWAIAAGTIPWAALLLVFHQHRLERLEAMETEELAAQRGQGVFEAAAAEGQAAARRLRLMHSVLVPVASLVYAGALAISGWYVVRFLGKADDPQGDGTFFSAGDSAGWQLAVCLSLALLAFIFSRFVSGMAEQPAWRNLRGGAGAMVGNSILLLAIAVGVVFGFFDRPAVLHGIAVGIGWFMAFVAAEVVVNLVLNVYRPRRPGDVPRPAFDSKVLGLFSAPDSIVRSAGEAVNYQFGFDVSSTWGYRLLLRSTAWLVVLAAVVLVLLSTVVVVEPGWQAIRLRGGEVLGEPVRASMLLKLPWPMETVDSFDVDRVRSIALGGTPAPVGAVNLWPIEGQTTSDRRPFLVAAPNLSAEVEQDIGRAAVPEEARILEVGNRFALVEADIVLKYRVRDGGLGDWLDFVDTGGRARGGLDMRERALRAIALREASRLFAQTGFDQVLSPRGDSLVASLRERVQKAFDEAGSGVEVVGIDIPTLRPPPEAAAMFEERAIDIQNAQTIVGEARRMSNTTMAALVGGTEIASRAVAAIERLRKIEREQGRDSAEARALRAEVEGMLLEARAQAASVVSAARARRWDVLMEARRVASVVLGQAASYRAAPDLYRERAIMQVLGRTLAAVRIKYVLGVDPERTRFDIQMQQPDPGLNLADYLEKKSDDK